MQDRYVGDVGDFGKYGLLRALSSPLRARSSLSLGVVWYFVPDEGNTADGGKIGYLNLPRDRAAFFRECDSALYDRLQGLVKGRRRDIQSVKEARMLPAGTVFFGEPLTFNGVARSEKARLSHRAAWLEAAYRATAACNLVFLDPDNGLGSTVVPHGKQGVKYAYPAEARAYLKRGQSVVIYHHLGRRGNAKQQIMRQFRRLVRPESRGTVFALLYHRGTARVFFVVESGTQKHRLLDRASSMLEGPWSRHFELVTPNGVRV
jgi:hypothetical protein